MPSYTINGYNIEFPKEAYGSQIRYMEHVLRALSTGQNALLESPTGTGKTLCLLCAVLAWQDTIKSRVPKKSTGSGATAKGNGYPVIVYASRTHTQLSQVVAELKSTAYRPKMTILGSRDQLCVNQKMSKFKGTVLNSACSALCATHNCYYRNNLDKYNGFVEGSDGSRAPILDIEDLMALGKKDSICGYYYSRMQLSDSDLVLLPYNYLLDPVVRARVDINWKNAIIIFDEAHNLERSACEAASVTITSTMLTSVIDECKTVIKVLQSGASSNESGAEASKASSASASAVSKGDGKSKLPGLDAVVNMLKALFSLEEVLDNAPLRQQEQFGGERSSKALALPGSWLFSTLEDIGLPYEKAADTLIQLSRMQELLVNQSAELLESTGGTAAAAQEPKLVNIYRLLSRAFRGENKAKCQKGSFDYKVFLTEEKQKAWNSFGPVSQQPKKATRKLCFWSFSPGIALEELKKVGVGSILLTSGTLSPLGAFQEDMKVPFAVQLENPHVINNNQFWVGAVATGVDGKRLNSSFNFRDTTEYQDCLGNSILHVLKTGAAGGVSSRSASAPAGLQQPQAAAAGGFVSNISVRAAKTETFDAGSTELNGGVLVFFPSYDVMERTTNRWRASGIYEQLERVGGAIILEPRGAAGGAAAGGGSSSSSSKEHGNKGRGGYSGYPKKVAPVATSGMFGSDENAEDSAAAIQMEENQIKSLVSQLDRVLLTEKRCIVMAVFQGKVSEGIDFKDARGRVIIVTGIPFPPMMDPWVVLKKQHLDERKKIGGAGSGALNGTGWYMQSASRAVNQALGRIIRHKKDWGAIFLMDDRFLNDNQISNLSKWIRPGVTKFSTLSPSLQSFRTFLNNSYDNPELAVQEPVKLQRRPSVTIGYEAPRNQVDDSRIKTMAVEASSITSGAGYIDPAFLRSQQQAPSTNADASRASQSSQAEAKPAMASRGGLASALAMNINPFAADRKTQQSSSSSAVSLTGRESSGGTSGGTSSSRGLSLPGYSGGASGTSSSGGLSLPGYSGGASGGSSSGGLSLPGSSGGASGGSSSGGSSLPGFSRGKLKDLIGSRLTAAKGVAATSSDVSNKRDTLKVLKERVKEKAPAEMANAFAGVLIKVKEHQFASIVNIQQFVSELVASFTPPKGPSRTCVLSAEEMVFMFDALMCLIPAKHMELYIASVEKTLRILMLQKKPTVAPPIAASNSLPNPPSKPAPTTSAPNPNARPPEAQRNPAGSIRSAGYGAPASQILSKFPDQLSQYDARPADVVADGTGTWQPSKRAKLLAGNTVPTSKPTKPAMSGITPGAVKPSPLAFLKNRSALPPPPPSQSQSRNQPAAAAGTKAAHPATDEEDVLAVVSGFKFGTKGSKFVEQVCNVCMDTARRPCANSCGHICCEACWKKWLGSSISKESCPVCRQPASINMLVFVVRKE